MFDFLRVAGFATLALGAAGVPGNSAITAPAAASVAAPVTEPIALGSASAPAIVQLPDDIRAEAGREEALATPLPSEPRAESLTALVHRHATAETTDREQHCLASAIYFESKGEPLDGQLAVAHVIMNRADSGRFASTLCGVVLQRGQFSFVRGGTMPAIARDGSNWRTAVAIAKIAQGDLWNSTTGNALYFHARRVAPAWRMARVGAIGNHVFYR